MQNKENIHRFLHRVKPKIFLVKALLATSSKRLPSVSDRDHFFGLTVNDFLLLLTSWKSPHDAFPDLKSHNGTIMVLADLYFRCTGCALCYLEYTKNFSDNMEPELRRCMQ